MIWVTRYQMTDPKVPILGAPLVAELPSSVFLMHQIMNYGRITGLPMSPLAGTDGLTRLDTRGALAKHHKRELVPNASFDRFH